MRSRFSILASAIALVMAITLVGPSAGLTQDGEISPVIDVHRGTCAELDPEPAFKFGAMQLVPFGPGAEGGVAETVDEDEDVDVPDADIDTGVVGDDGVFDENDEGFLADDYDDDGVVEIGRDLNEDGTLQEDEFLGDDVDGDGALDSEELLMVAQGDQVAEGHQSGQVWKADEADLEADGEELVTEGPYSMAVHQSEQQYDTVLACGEILDLVEEEQVVVPLRPVAGSQYVGVALIEQDSGEYAAFLLEGVEQPAPPTPTETPTPPPTDTPPPPTNTPVEVTEVVTEVVEEEVTEVITEVVEEEVTEVVTEVVEVEATQTPTPAS